MKKKKKEHTVKFGGMQFVNNVSEEQINEFVANLPDEKRDSLAEVAHELQQAGMISMIPGEFKTIDRDQEDEQETHPEMTPDPYAENEQPYAPGEY